MIRILLVDDHVLVRRGFRALIDSIDDFTVVGEATNSYEAIKMVNQLVPDVVLMDISMPDMNGIQALERINALRVQTHVIFLTMHTERSLVRQALHNGAKGYLPKAVSLEELMVAIRAANEGNTYVSPSVTPAILTELVPASAYTDGTMLLEQLSPREREVLRLIAEGHTNDETASILNVSVKTVENYRSNIMSKLDVHNVVKLVHIAIKMGLIVVDQ